MYNTDTYLLCSLLGNGRYRGAEYWVQKRIASCPYTDHNSGDNSGGKSNKSSGSNSSSISSKSSSSSSSVNNDHNGNNNNNENNDNNISSTSNDNSDNNSNNSNNGDRTHGLEFHFDKDEEAAESSDTWLHPTYSTGIHRYVYYDLKI